MRGLAAASNQEGLRGPKNAPKWCTANMRDRRQFVIQILKKACDSLALPQLGKQEHRQWASVQG
jgi:hypothetical protein